MSKLDKLFKDKLEGDSLQPSAQAWEKVEAHLGKKNKMVVWLRVAASLVLFGAITVAGLKYYEAPKEQYVKKEEGDRRQEIERATSNEQRADNSKKETRKSSTPVKKEKVQPVIQPQVAIVEQPTEVVIEPTVVETVQDPAPRTSNPAPSTQNPAPTKGITLTYSLPSVKKPIAEQTEPAVAKKTGFERVLEIAKEVKNGDPLGELREAKDDILAWDFKRDKDKEKKKQTGL